VNTKFHTTHTTSIQPTAAIASLAACCLALVAVSATAMDKTAMDKSAMAKTSKSANKTVDIRTWKLDPADGWSVRTLVGKPVRGPGGEEVGEVESIVFGPEGKVLKLILSTGGILGIGDKNLAVKFSDVRIGPDYDYVTTPITAASVEKFGLFDGVAEKSGDVGPRQWRSSELIGDYVQLKEGIRYAYVRDLIVSKEGQLQAVIVSPDVGYSPGLRGYYAYPFYGYGHGYGWNPGNAYYDLPYGKTDIADLVPYAYNKR
jgi:sporulation protein YlmC with PRC-barrel domain